MQTAKNNTLGLFHSVGNWSEGVYSYGFNGMEGDPEVYGDGIAYTTEFRQLDTRLGRWWSVDPMVAQLPWQSPYNSMDNNPIRIIDPKGLYGTEAEAKQKQNEAKENGYEVGEIYQSGDEYGFASSIVDGEWEHNFTKDYFGNNKEELQTLTFEVQSDGVENDEGDIFAKAVPIALTLSALDGPLPIGDAIGAIVLAGATTYDAKERIFITYTMTNSKGDIYVGRSSGHGDPLSNNDE